MNPANKDSHGIPSRNGVHFRAPSSAAKNSSSTDKKASSGKPNARRISKVGSEKAGTHSGIRGTTPLVKKTPVDISIEKEYAEKEKRLRTAIADELKKIEILKKEKHKRDLERLRAGSSEIMKGVVIGIIIALVIGLLIVFLYYRSLSKYSMNSSKYSVECYEYLDTLDTSEENLKKITARKAGNESPAITLDGKTRVVNGVLYIPYSAISEFFNLSIAGDNNSRTVIAGTAKTDYSGENTAVFYFDTPEIEVNSSKQFLSSVPFMDGEELFIPFEFIEVFVKGILIETKNDRNLTSISVTKEIENIYFIGSSNAALDSPAISDYTNDTVALYEYTVDLSEYNKYIEPADPDMYLTLVNVNNRLPADYVPDDLINVKTSESRRVQQMRHDAGMALKAFLIAADAAGFGDISVTSGYRSYSQQTSMFNQKLEANLKMYDPETAESLTLESIMYPGASEHQSGLCADMHNMTTAMQSFSSTPAYKWLVEHCADFGFILRYPQTKETITGVKFEPWHFRFVGRVHAQKIMATGLSLEEYLENYTSSKPR